MPRGRRTTRASLAIDLAEQQVDVVGDARLLRARRSIVGGNDRVDEHFESCELRRREELELRRRIRFLNAGKREQPSIGEPWQCRDASERLERGSHADRCGAGRRGSLHGHIMRRRKTAIKTLRIERFS